MGWAHRTESHTSTQKSSKRIASEGSEAWFSGQESDGSDDENERNALKELLPVEGPIDQGHETHSRTTQRSIKAPNVAVMQSVSGASTSMGITEGGHVSIGASTVSRPEYIALVENETGENISTITIDQSPSLTGDGLLATIDEGMTYTGNLTLPVSDHMKMGDDLIREEPPEVDKTEGKDGELKRRKLQRNKQVLEGTFEEWQEAYSPES